MFSNQDIIGQLLALHPLDLFWSTGQHPESRSSFLLGLMLTYGVDHMTCPPVIP